MTTTCQVFALGDMKVDRKPKGFDVSSQPWHLLKSKHVLIANLESPLTDRGFPADKYITMRSDPQAAAVVKKIGVDIASVANNHALDYGYDGFSDTLLHLRNEGIDPVGGGKDLSEALSPVTRLINGVKIAVLGFACTLPAGFAATNDRPGIAPIRVEQSHVLDWSVQEQPGSAPYVVTRAVPEDVDQACAAIRSAKEEHDVCIISIHWGVPRGWAPQFQSELATYQRPLGYKLLDAGADAIIGHHAHCVHGVELCQEYDNKPIFYSLGNFIFHSWRSASGDKSLQKPGPPYQMSKLTSSRNYETVAVRLTVGRIGVHSIDVIPLVLNADGEPEVPDSERRDEILDRFIALSAEVDTELKASSGRVFANLRPEN